VNAFFQELVHAGIYKRSQGRITRQVTWAAMALTVGLGLWRLSLMLKTSEWQWVKTLVQSSGFHFWLPGVLLVSGLWIAYRLVNLPAFADFLIAVEAEMNKVSWPSRSELFRAAMVVLFTIFFLAGVLYGFDLFWKWFFQSLEIFPTEKPNEVALAALGFDWRALFSVIPGVS
jgi:preprotein translocase subunit SecE